MQYELRRRRVAEAIYISNYDRGEGALYAAELIAYQSAPSDFRRIVEAFLVTANSLAGPKINSADRNGARAAS
jgi:hypothetical protein